MIPVIKPERVSTEIIKPSSTTPADHPTTHSLSFFDQICSRIYVPFIFFYPKQKQYNHHLPSDDNAQKSTLLKKSLSAALSGYYPLAGRIRDDVTIDCNDLGIEFVEAKITCDLSEILKNPDDETIKLMFSDDLQYKDPILSSLMIVQVTFFDCGGIAVAICISHKILDISAMCYFINEWADIARKPGEKKCPEFKIASFYPPIDLPVIEIYEPEKVKCISRRLVFNASKIAKLRAIVAKEVPNPTRVEVVTALVYKCAISATRASSGSLKSTVMHKAANLRARVFPPFPESSSGNLSGTFPVSTGEDSEIELVWLARKIKKEKTEYCNSCGREMSAKELCSFILEASTGFRSCHGMDQDVYLCSSFCRFPFYKADFGWGKPEWVTTASCGVKNVITLMDTREGDGIEVLLTLEENDMAVFEHDAELLAFADINPSALPETNVES
ncbi:hypothetical protein P3X46_017597 [Hevea brasiliensis]|uniref:Uncharacterized protein n=1 Tax=Hevea brasiliensis TaxID=3981 RepID=A0ABQ9LPE1_HEVBR|nr:acylsugar acyltransferase 3-like [Hevea brasiliensis]KAJ9169395.1 hypothetical protein P3X46_017597 [Hevea brasiliensis]